MQFHIVTLGCDKNTVDSERYYAELVAYGGQPVADPGDAELVVVNTCGFIDAAKAESIEAIVQAARLKEGGSCRMVAAVGCLIERHRRELSEALPEVDLFLGTRDTHELIVEVQSRGLLRIAPPLVHPGVRLYAGDLPHVRYLKISEGCDHGCAFCAIPLMRGKFRSFGIDDVVREAQLLQLQGAREVNLVAQDLAHYGRDTRDGNGLRELLLALLRDTDIPWFRLLYIYSAGLTPDLLELMAADTRVVRYLDVPMQHAADTVLARMRRPERRSRQRDRLMQIRDLIPDVTIRTTVITGFPGETEDEFQQLLDFISEGHFDRVGVFPFSPQEGTRAFEMPDDVPDEVKRERAERVLEVQRMVTAERYEGMLGRTVRALVDRVPDTGPPQARFDAQADDIDGVTWLLGSDDAAASVNPGDLLEVRLTEVVDDFDFRAEVIRRSSAPAHVTAPVSARTLPVISSVGAYGRQD